MPEKIAFSSASLPSRLSERARFNLWRDIHEAQIAAVDFSASADLQFEASFEGLPVGPLLLSQMAGTLTQADRTPRRIVADASDAYCLFINIGDTDMQGTQLGRDYLMEPGGGALVAMSDAGTIVGRNRNKWFNLMIPNQMLANTFAGVNDRAARSIRPDNEALGLLWRYCRMIGSGPVLTAPALIGHATETIIDLVGLVIGATGETAEIAGTRGRRAVRRLAVVGQIEANFADPSVSAHSVARELNLSARYVHALLQETGIGFTERVLELRLQKAVAMLTDRRYDGMLISDIALAAGFSDISYFNRSFRRRFGCTPGSIR